jgi:hypothetical protein
MTVRTATFRFRVMMAFFITGLVISGVTAFPLLGELEMLARWLGVGEATSAAGHTGLEYWILTVKFGLQEMYAAHPWIAYGTDWLAFGHIVIALFFVGPLLRPEGSRQILLTGMAACVLVIPLALICGEVRGIPFYWRLIDCSFGICGIVPLGYCWRLLGEIEAASAKKSRG